MKKKRLLAFVLAALTAVSLAAQGAAECACPDAYTHEQRQQIIDDVLARYDTMGASIAIVSGGQVVDTFVYGRANRAENLPVTEDTYFKIASVTKMVSALGVMRLVENRWVGLDADASAYLPCTLRNPYFPDTPVTVRQKTVRLFNGYYIFVFIYYAERPARSFFAGCSGHVSRIPSGAARRLSRS